MSLILAAVLAVSPVAASPVLPFIDRQALHALAKFEAAKGRRPGAPARGGIAARKARTIAALCREAGVAPRSADAAPDLGRVYSMAGPEVSILRSTCLRSSAPLRTASIAGD